MFQSFRPPPETLINIALPEDGDELTQQSELFEQVCNERMQTRQEAVEGDDAEDNETWLQSTRRSWYINQIYKDIDKLHH